ncbi:hypothetical protein GCM10010324_55210 [Streptomyces hiroshimensis]|uniref:Uncharacterized protein n=1 Tax=Streptomyces hiroshimensis TaxID=66424 RepID=A0ABQ2Z475_9ACTN|nr:hypothetical protein GCM10010324_55210 [Streptomyces hiroshimensis]
MRDARCTSAVATTLAYGGNFDLYDVRRWADLSMGALRTYLDSEDVKASLHVPADVTWNCAGQRRPGGRMAGEGQ